jgi:hypothetical protein
MNVWLLSMPWGSHAHPQQSIHFILHNYISRRSRYDFLAVFPANGKVVPMAQKQLGRIYGQGSIYFGPTGGEKEIKSVLVRVLFSMKEGSTNRPIPYRNDKTSNHCIGQSDSNLNCREF